MNAGRIAWSILGLLSLSLAVRAGPVVYTDREAFLAAAGDVHEIDFETLLDGSLSYFDAKITPEFNYTAQGVTFSSPVPHLGVSGSPGSFELEATSYPTGQRNWITADLVVPATAVGFEFPGGTHLSLFDQQGQPLGTWLGGGPHSPFFLGVVAEDWSIGRALVDQGQSSQTIDTLFFSPVPEPATLALLTVGSLVLLQHRRRLWRGHSAQHRTRTVTSATSVRNPLGVATTSRIDSQGSPDVRRDNLGLKAMTPSACREHGSLYRQERARISPHKLSRTLLHTNPRRLLTDTRLSHKEKPQVLNQGEVLVSWPPDIPLPSPRRASPSPMRSPLMMF